MRARATRFAFAVLVVVTLLPRASACLWDYDTLAMERARFPDALELICGKFARHSPAFYRWRIEDRLARLKRRSSPVMLNDVAVAYDKLGEHDQAIATTLACVERHSRSYQTAANLGTFHIHAGRLEEGLKHIEDALTINPDAHFGRERYQKWLVEYLLAKKTGGLAKLPLDPQWPEEHYYWHRYRGFALYLIERFAPDTLSTDEPAGVDSREEPEELLIDGVAGVLGMMRFGKYDSPVLLEAFGDLLVASHRDTDGKRLAARAYLKASYEVEDAAAAEAYRSLAERCLEIHVDHDEVGMPPLLTLEALERRFQAELADAQRWYSEVEANERRWIAEGGDVDAQFQRVYYQEKPRVYSPRPWTYGGILAWRLAWMAAVMLGLPLALLCGCYRWKAKRKSKPAQDS